MTSRKSFIRSAALVSAFAGMQMFSHTAAAIDWHRSPSWGASGGSYNAHNGSSSGWVDDKLRDGHCVFIRPYIPGQGYVDTWRDFTRVCVGGIGFGTSGMFVGGMRLQLDGTGDSVLLW